MQKPSIKVNGSGDALMTRIQTIMATVNTKLGDQADKYLCIRDKDVFIDYFDQIIKNRYLSVDTETDGLNPMMCTMAGICLFTHGRKPAYAPMHHTSFVTGVEVPDQIPDELVKSQLARLNDYPDVYLDLFSAKFDQRVIYHNLGVMIKPSWDGYIGARLLNENEPHNQLKKLWDKYCNDGQGNGFTYDELFKGIPFTMVPISAGYIYAAGDPIKTMELNDFQRR